MLDPDSVLRGKIIEFVDKGDFGLASGQRRDGSYERVWFEEPIGPEEVAFEADVFLLNKQKAKALKGSAPAAPAPEPVAEPVSTGLEPEPEKQKPIEPGSEEEFIELSISGNIPPELWNRLGTKILPKLRGFDTLEVGVGFKVRLPRGLTESVKTELRQILSDLGLENRIRIE